MPKGHVTSHVCLGLALQAFALQAFALQAFGALLTQEHDPVAVLLRLGTDASEEAYELRYSSLLAEGGWRAHADQFVKSYNGTPFGRQLNLTALEVAVELKLRALGFQAALVEQGSQLELESDVTSHDAVTRMLIASTQLGGSEILTPKVRLHIRGEVSEQRHFFSPLHPLLYARSRAFSEKQYINTVQLTNSIMGSLGLTVPSSLVITKSRLAYNSFDSRRPYAQPQPSPPPPVPSAPLRRRIKTLFLVYSDTPNGSAQLSQLAAKLQELGHASILCLTPGHAQGQSQSQSQGKDEDAMCLAPPVEAVVVTDERCGEAPSHRGRRVRYILSGSHVVSEAPCRAVSLPSSHFLAAQLGSQVLGGLFLTAPPPEAARRSLAELLLKSRLLASLEDDTSFFEKGFVSSVGVQHLLTAGASPASQTAASALSAEVDWLHGRQRFFKVVKENIVVFDSDVQTRFEPELPVTFNLPPNCRLVYAAEVDPVELPLLLQRAKVFVDLALPGPESLITQAVLWGAVPVVSGRWNGVSNVDFPGAVRADAQSADSLSGAIAYALANYEALVDGDDMAAAFAHAVSTWDRHHQTALVLASSASLHFVLVARDMKEETAAVLQAFAVIYLFPLASVDLFVTDVKMFARHHTTALLLLQRAGYTFSAEEEERQGENHAFVRIRSLSLLQTCGSPVAPSWAHAIVALSAPSDLAFVEPSFLLELVEVVEAGQPSGAGVVVARPGQERSLAHIFTLEAAKSVHACQPEQIAVSRLFSAVAEGVALLGEAEPVLVKLEDSAVIKLSTQTQTSTNAHATFIDGLALSPAWASLVHFYSQIA